ncbi:hypothetical protein DSO57_1035794 [Entomophthora muscae]|uniref:Uncharacterized protein n=1 Tax=Entomophthora muscae TaxID=34485 RepID=A0ACC2S1E7_9FUNG|nr:hypothetical protein DSO57_1035794 [Entomophthora muscae]
MVQDAGEVSSLGESSLHASLEPSPMVAVAPLLLVEQLSESNRLGALSFTPLIPNFGLAQFFTPLFGT